MIYKCSALVILLGVVGSTHAASSSTMTCDAMTSGKSENEEENIKILATQVPKSAAKFLTENIRKEFKEQGANDFSAFSASLDYYAETALPLAREVTAQFALIARHEGSYVNGIKRYCKDKNIGVGDFFHQAFDAALEEKLEEAAKNSD
jgi:hypothetical protein